MPNDKEQIWIGKLKGDTTVSHHELVQFMYVFNTSEPVARHAEYDVYLYEDRYFYSTTIGKSVILLKVVFI